MHAAQFSPQLRFLHAPVLNPLCFNRILTCPVQGGPCPLEKPEIELGDLPARVASAEIVLHTDQQPTNSPNVHGHSTASLMHSGTIGVPASTPLPSSLVCMPEFMLEACECGPGFTKLQMNSIQFNSPSKVKVTS